MGSEQQLWSQTEEVNVTGSYTTDMEFSIPINARSTSDCIRSRKSSPHRILRSKLDIIQLDSQSASFKYKQLKK